MIDLFELIANQDEKSLEFVLSKTSRSLIPLEDGEGHTVLHAAVHGENPEMLHHLLLAVTPM